ncbi:MAG TPA: 50S ribosomal protein L4 [Isosphaeraceae bacterium]|jgi:large subunit ribosomal protein L4
MLTVPVYNRTGERVGEETIDPADFGGVVNKQLLHDVVLMHQAARRVGTVNTRGRADVAGSGKKLYRQKGTGNARVGAKRTNKRKGGGVAFARRNRDYRYTIPKKAVRSAIRMALLTKFQDGQALVVEDLGPRGPDARPKTKEVVQVLRAITRPDLEADVTTTPQQDLEHKRRSGRLGKRKRAELEAATVAGAAETTPAAETKARALRRTLDHRSLLIGIPQPDPVLYRSARNIEGVIVAPVAEFNTYDILDRRYLLLTREALAALKEQVKAKRSRRPSRAAGPEVAAPADAQES